MWTWPRLYPALPRNTRRCSTIAHVSKLAFVGGGNMAEALVHGLLAQDLMVRDRIMISDPNPHRRDVFAPLHVSTTDRNDVAVDRADVVILAIKPQTFEHVLSELKAHLSSSTLVVSMIAGTPLSAYHDILGQEACIVRTMPNTPAMIGQGMTVWSKSNRVSESQVALTRCILESFGEQVFVQDEKELDMATALSGSGPAYFLLVAEAMIDTGVHMGFSRHVATKLVEQTMVGTALYLKQSSKHPVELRNDITSPGGTTAAAMYRAEKNAFRADISDSIWAAYERCLEMAAPYPVARKRPRN